MQHLQKAYDLAYSRGYLSAFQTWSYSANAPAWLQALNTSEGIAALEARIGCRVPESVRELYECPSLVAFLESIGNDSFYLQYLEPEFSPPYPPSVRVGEMQYLLVSHHSHGSTWFAVELSGKDDPLVYPDFAIEPQEPLGFDSHIVPFSVYIFETVEQFHCG